MVFKIPCFILVVYYHNVIKTSLYNESEENIMATYESAKEKLLYNESEENNISEYSDGCTLMQAVEEANKNNLVYLYRKKWLHPNTLENNNHCYFKYAQITSDQKEIILHFSYINEYGNMICNISVNTLTAKDVLAKDWILVKNNNISDEAREVITAAKREILLKQQTVSWQDAMLLIKDHKRVSRKAYDKKDNLIFEKIISVRPTGDGPFALICVPNFINMLKGIYFGNVYFPTKEDMVANDWYVVTDDDIAAINCQLNPFGSIIDADGDILLF